MLRLIREFHWLISINDFSCSLHSWYMIFFPRSPRKKNENEWAAVFAMIVSVYIKATPIPFNVSQIIWTRTLEQKLYFVFLSKYKRYLFEFYNIVGQASSQTKGKELRSLLATKGRSGETDIYKIHVHTFSWSPWADQWVRKRFSVHSGEFYCQWFVDASSVYKNIYIYTIIYTYLPPLYDRNIADTE